MRNAILVIVLLSFSFIKPLFSTNNTSDSVLLKINDREITVYEFEYVYSKNNLNPQVMDPKSMEEYLELFINFNLKVYEAMQMGLDTHATFIDELEGYRKQLAVPYLTDQEVSNQLLDEALDRMRYDLRASHILINLEKHASPADTLAAWNKIMELRKKIEEGESFREMAIQYSDDPSAKGMPATANRPPMRGNGGDLGYFSVLDMVYPFENAVYNLEVGELSYPVRTDFGYHLIKLTDKLPAMGRAKVAHIMVSLPENATEQQKNQAKEKIQEIHQNILEGEEFKTLAERFSDDKASGRRGGELPQFTSNRMVPEFIKAINALNENNQISQPVRSQYGWHIIKLIEKSLPSEEDAMAEMKNKISRDARASLSQQVVVERLKKEYNFEEMNENLEVFFENVDSTIFEGKWDKSKIGKTNAVLFSFAGKTYSQQDFADYLLSTQAMRTPESVRAYVTTMYNNFTQQTLLAYEEQRLPEKYPEFKRIMNEYHDGILLFELTDQKVWSKAMQDTVGLRNFYNENIADYMWDDRYDAIIYSFDDEKEAKAGRKTIRKALRRNVTHEDLMAGFNKDSHLKVSAEKGVFEVSEKPALSSLDRNTGVSDVIRHNGHYAVVWVLDFIPEGPKKLNEIRGLVIADYQNYLEEKWINELRSKYKYMVNTDALKLIAE